MKNVADTFFRLRNAEFYVNLASARTVRSAAVHAKLGRAQAMRLLQFWVKKGLLVRQPLVKGGKKYIYTREGLEAFTLVEDVVSDVRVDDIWTK